MQRKPKTLHGDIILKLQSRVLHAVETAFTQFSHWGDKPETWDLSATTPLARAWDRYPPVLPGDQVHTGHENKCMDNE